MDVLVVAADQPVQIGTVGVGEELLGANAVILGAEGFPLTIDHRVLGNADQALGVGADVRLDPAKALGDRAQGVGLAFQASTTA